MIANVHEAKSQLSKLLDAVERGEEVVITRRGSGINRFRIIAEPVVDRSRLFGILKGLKLPTDAEWAESERAMEKMWDEYFEKLDNEE
jgi:prevent-host-death family protein